MTRDTYLIESTIKNTEHDL